MSDLNKPDVVLTYFCFRLRRHAWWVFRSESGRAQMSRAVFSHSRFGPVATRRTATRSTRITQSVKE